MRLAVVGGKLQGTEAAYLAGEAGYEVVLIDRRPGAPGGRPGRRGPRLRRDHRPGARPRPCLLSCDAVLPACEDDRALAFLASFVPGIGVPLLFDLDAYAVTQSKLRSNALFERARRAPSTRLAALRLSGRGQAERRQRQRRRELVSSEPGLALARARPGGPGRRRRWSRSSCAGPSLSIEM